jgi:DNA repair exonuclease SbcCD nuclease subunit
MLRILHTADWHIGRTYGHGFEPATARRLARDRLTVIDKILGLADQFDVHAVLCAGDLFDEPNPREDWWRGLVDAFIRRKNWKRPVVLLPGNHDPLTEESVYAPTHGFRRSLPEWVSVVDQEDFELPIAGGEAVVYAAPCRSMAGDRDLAKTLPPRSENDTRFRIGLVHGSTKDFPDHPANFPVSSNAPQERGLDYLALGDLHDFSDEGSLAPIVYPSAPEPTSFGETRAGCVAVVWFPRRGVRPEVQRQPVARWTWEQVTVRSLEELRALAARDLLNTVLRLRLELRLSLRELEEVIRILASLRGTDAVSARTGAFLCEPEDPNGLVRAGDIDLDGMPAAVRETATVLTQEGSPEATRALAVLQRLVHEVDR